MKTKNQPVLCYIGGRCAYFTTQALNKQWGDDWDDAPYEHNAEVPYEPHVAGEDWEITRVVFEAPLDTPDAGVSNSGYSVEMINRGDVAWLVPDQRGIIKDGSQPIPAGTTVSEFKRLIRLSGGEVYKVDLGE